MREIWPPGSCGRPPWQEEEFKESDNCYDCGKRVAFGNEAAYEEALGMFDIPTIYPICHPCQATRLLETQENT